MQCKQMMPVLRDSGVGPMVEEGRARSLGPCVPDSRARLREQRRVFGRGPSDQAFILKRT